MIRLLFILFTCSNLFGNEHLVKSAISIFPIPLEAIQTDFDIQNQKSFFVTRGNNRQFATESIELESEGLKWNFHKITGYAALVTGVGAIASGYMGGKNKPHCGLAVTSTALAVTSVCNGLYMYGNKINTPDGKVKNRLHVLGSVMSTIGFITVSLLPPEGEMHGPISALSGATFIISTGVLYF